MPVTHANLVDVTMHHPPREDQLPHYEAVRAAATQFIAEIINHTPSCADQQAAIRHARDAAMTANAAIALDGKI